MSQSPTGILSQGPDVPKWPCATMYLTHDCHKLVCEHGELCETCTAGGCIVPKKEAQGAFPFSKLKFHTQVSSYNDLTMVDRENVDEMVKLFGSNPEIEEPLRIVWDLKMALLIAHEGGDKLHALYLHVMTNDLVHICPALKWDTGVAKYALNVAQKRVRRYALFQMLEISLESHSTACVGVDGLLLVREMEVNDLTRDRFTEVVDDAVFYHDPGAEDGCVCIFCHYMAFRQHTQWILAGELSDEELPVAQAILLASQKLVAPTDENACGPCPDYVRGQQKALRNEPMASTEWERMMSPDPAYLAQQQLELQQQRQQQQRQHDQATQQDGNQPTAAVGRSVQQRRQQQRQQQRQDRQQQRQDRQQQRQDRQQQRQQREQREQHQRPQPMAFAQHHPQQFQHLQSQQQTHLQPQQQTHLQPQQQAQLQPQQQAQLQPQQQTQLQPQQQAQLQPQMTFEEFLIRHPAYRQVQLDCLEVEHRRRLVIEVIRQEFFPMLRTEYWDHYEQTQAPGSVGQH